MGQTNRKNLEDLLDQVSNNTHNTQDHHLEDSFTTENTLQEEQEDNSVSEDTGDESLTTKNRVPSMDWEPKSQLKIGYDLVMEASQKIISPVKGQVPSHAKPDLEETCLFVPAVKEAINRSTLPAEGVNSRVGDNQVNAADWISRDYLEVDGRFHRIKLYASILDSYNIPWTVSKYKLKIRRDGQVHQKVTAIIEFGVLHLGDDPDWEVRHHLEQTTDSMAVESHYAQAEYSHEKHGIYYFPIGSNKRHVAACGVFNNSSLMDYSTSDDVLKAEHLEVLKQGSRK